MLSRTVALPVIVGAAVLKGGAPAPARACRREQRAAFAAGTAASFASTLASQALIRLVERDSALWPYSAYRAGLAALVLGRLAAQRAARAARLGDRDVRGTASPPTTAQAGRARPEAAAQAAPRGRVTTPTRGRG